MSGPRNRATNRLSNLVAEGGRSRDYTALLAVVWDRVARPEEWR